MSNKERLIMCSNYNFTFFIKQYLRNVVFVTFTMSWSFFYKMKIGIVTGRIFLCKLEHPLAGVLSSFYLYLRSLVLIDFEKRVHTGCPLKQQLQCIILNRFFFIVQFRLKHVARFRISSILQAKLSFRSHQNYLRLGLARSKNLIDNLFQLQISWFANLEFACFMCNNSIVIISARSFLLTAGKFVQQNDCFTGNGLVQPHRSGI